MINAVIITDGLIGANDAGAILSQDGFKVATILRTGYMEQFEGYDVLCISTSGRGISRDETYDRVQETTVSLPKSDFILYSKRIDSILRGNAGTGVDSTLDYLGEDYKVVAVASFPGSGRTSIDDILLINGVPLQMAEAVNDPTSPIHTSRITEIAKWQSQYPVGYIGLEQVVESSGRLLEELLKQAEEHRIIVVDAQTAWDIDVIVACCAVNGLEIAAIDPGSFTAALAGNLFKRKKEVIQKELLRGIGSANNLTEQQLQYLEENANPLVVRIRATELFNKDRCRAEVRHVMKEVRAAEESHSTAVTTTTESRGNVVDLSKIDGAKHSSMRECAGVVTNTIAQALHDLIGGMDGRVDGVYAPGEDVAATFCRKLGVSGFHVEGETIPLAIYSNITSGSHQGLPVVIEGGLVGREDTLMQYMEYFETVA